MQHLVFSGGVSEHVYDRDPKAYGDIGPVLGKNMRDYLKKLPKDVLREPIEGIRATVIGAGEYTIQASGNTSYVSNEKALPVHGLKGHSSADPRRRIGGRSDQTGAPKV